MQLEQTYAQHPEQIPELFVQAWNRKNAIELANIFVEDAEFVNVVGLWWHSRQAIWKAHDYGLRVIFPDSTLEVRRIKTQLLSQDIALIHARMKLSGQRALHGINQPGDRQTIFSFVGQQKEKGWVCVSAHNTDIVPGKETHIIDHHGEISSVDYRKK